MTTLELKLTLLSLIVLTNLFGQITEKVFLDKGDATQNFYTLFYPTKLPISGYIVIIPGFGETAEDVLEQTDLPITAAQNGLLTIIPTFQDGVLSFGIDPLSQESLNAIIQDVRSKHELVNQRFFIGGFSIGGSTAVKYAQNASAKPTAVFAIDPQLDFERFYNSCKRSLRLSSDKEPNPEHVYMIERIEKEFDGTPKTALSNFHEISPYSYSDPTQAAVKKFGDIPLRIYSEPDVNWWLEERNADFTGMNITDCAAVVNELNRLGNRNAELIVTANKGYRRPNNLRHPHAWSIADDDALVEWLLKCK